MPRKRFPHVNLLQDDRKPGLFPLTEKTNGEPGLSSLARAKAPGSVRLCLTLVEEESSLPQKRPPGVLFRSGQDSRDLVTVSMALLS